MKVSTIKAHVRSIMAGDDPKTLLKAFAADEDPRTLKRIDQAWRSVVRQMTRETNDPDNLGNLFDKMLVTAETLTKLQRAGKE